MESEEQEDELALAKISANLLSDLDVRLSHLLFKRSAVENGPRVLHTSYRKKDVESVVKLIEPFQSDPQLLDHQLKHIVPLIAESYLQHLQQRRPLKDDSQSSDLTIGLSVVLYTLCKVRGRKVISGLLNNEPRYFELILKELEECLNDAEVWQKQFVLLLWLSHLLLAPFDLASIAIGEATSELPHRLNPEPGTPPIAQQMLRLFLTFLPRSAATQPVAALALSRLTSRPDMQQWRLAERLVDYSLAIVVDQSANEHVSLYPTLGNMRLLANITSSSGMQAVIPHIYRAYTVLLAGDHNHTIELNAVGRTLLVKTARNIVITAVRGAPSNTQFQNFVESSDVLETVIDYLIRSLSDRETSVRQAAGKALSVIVQTLGAEMGGEIISTILHSLTEELPSLNDISGSSTVDSNALHGYTLAIAFNLFNRSVAVDQLHDMATILLTALAFEQRTATGSVSGTNVRDAANFGIWSLARRYTTSELLAANVDTTSTDVQSYGANTIIETVAMHLLQSACCDPVGNIRRGSSAALQELVGRHPDIIAFGIDLVQAVDYQAVGLRQRALNDVAAHVMSLDTRYWDCLMQALSGWRGLGSADVASRDAAAHSINRQLTLVDSNKRFDRFNKILEPLPTLPSSDIDRLHGILLTASVFVEHLVEQPPASTDRYLSSLDIWQAIPDGVLATAFSPRAVREQVPVAIARLATAIFVGITRGAVQINHFGVTLPDFGPFFEQLLGRSEKTILAVVPELVMSLCDQSGSIPIELFDSTVEMLATKLNHASAKPTVQGAARAFALAACINAGSTGDELKLALKALQTTCRSPHVDWRIIGLEALGVVLQSQTGSETLAKQDFAAIQDLIRSGLRDYTVDERGDIGSLVRLQALHRVENVLGQDAFNAFEEGLLAIHADVLRLSLEKLTRVRLEAAHCRGLLPQASLRIQHFDEADSFSYFEEALKPLWQAKTPPWATRALVEGVISSAGSAAEHILQHARSVVASNLAKASRHHLHSLMNVFTTCLKDSLDRPATIQPALELLGFLLQMRLLEPLYETDFRWRALLSTVQKSHFKSTDVPRLLAAVTVYVGLGEVLAVRAEVLKKLLSMVKTSPYPKVRAACADALYMLTEDQELKKRDWSQPAINNSSTLSTFERRLQSSKELS